MRLSVIGATGVVGREIIKLLDEGFLGFEELRLFASSRSAGAVVEVKGKSYVIEELSNASPINSNVSIFSAGADTALEFASGWVDSGAVVVDNSSAFRMEEEVPLVVPEVNPEKTKNLKRGIISNPNCSTIQAVVVLKPLLQAYGIRRVVYSTYQAVSGAGSGGIRDLQEGAKGVAPTKFKHQIYANVIPHIDDFLDNGYTKEETKMINETRKILNMPDLKVTATTVRVPVFNGHSISINVEMERGFEISEVKELLANSPGIELRDDPQNAVYPMPIQASGINSVLVGRVRRDDSQPNTLNLWCSADNVRKGAALNALQIAAIFM